MNHRWNRATPYIAAFFAACLFVSVTVPLATCARPGSTSDRGIENLIGSISPRVGDEIMIAGKMVHTGAPVVLWFDPGGFDAYRVERRFAPRAESGWETISGSIGSPNRFGSRTGALDDEALERIRGGGWTLEDLQETVDQFVLHYDASGTSRQCFKILHDIRGLSVHFLLDIDGTIYQTLDVKEKAWHATKSNDRSVGIEIAHIGAYPTFEGTPLTSWYSHDQEGPRIELPGWLGDSGVRTPGFIGRPATETPVTRSINERELTQFDFTDEQYESLIKLTAAICTALPRIRCEYPRTRDGSVLDHAMADEVFESYTGLLGHWHVQENKIDPGPAFDWDRVVSGANSLMQD